MIACSLSALAVLASSVIADAGSPPAAGVDDLRAAVAEMLADAQTRASLLAGSGTSGFDKGFFVTSDDGDFKLVLNGVIQFRHLVNHSDQPPAGGDDVTHGFQNARTRLSFGGFLGDRTWKYYVLTGSGASGSWGVLDAYIRKHLGDTWFVQWGQFKLPLMYEWMVTERTQQFVDRSLVEAHFSPSYSQGVMLGVEHDAWRAFAAFSDGLRARDTDFSEGARQLTADWAATGRVEFKPIGAWTDYTDYQSFRDGKELLVVGAAVHGQDGRDVFTASDRTIVRSTVDVSWKLGGANIAGALVHSHEATTGADFDKLGAVIQAGVFVSDPLELIARYEWGDLDGAGTIEQDLNLLTVGCNYYFARHAMKLTLDAGYAFDAIDPLWTGSGRGFLPDAPGQDGQVVVRAQFQVLF